MNPIRVSLLIGGALVVAIAVVAVQARRPTEPRSAAPVEKKDALGIPAQALASNPIATQTVVRTRLAADLQIVGSVSYDQDHYAVVGPLVPGRITALQAGLGDRVRAGQILAEVESAEVGQAQAAFRSASARAGTANANARRERELAEQHISSAREREVAEAQAVSESAEMQAAVERLRSFGLSKSDIDAFKVGGGGGRIPLRAPIAGTIVSRTITLGQAVERATDAFKIIDLAHLWVLLDLYEKDLGRVYLRQAVELRTEALPDEVFHGRVTYIHPVIDEKTRTATVRIEFDNAGGKLRPGQFVTARVIGDTKHEQAEVLAVSRRAVQTVDGKTLVFVRGPRGFVRRFVEVGRSGGDLVELREGVAAGDEVATDGAFLLKSEMLR